MLNRNQNATLILTRLTYFKQEITFQAITRYLRPAFASCGGNADGNTHTPFPCNRHYRAIFKYLVPRFLIKSVFNRI